jgi:hypothetical protein
MSGFGSFKAEAAASLPTPSSSSLDEEETPPRLLCEDGCVIFLRCWRTVSYLGVFFVEVGGITGIYGVAKATGANYGA